MFKISNSELAKKKPAGKYATCKGCGEKHLLQRGKKKMPDGTYREDGIIGFVKCSDGKLYLASVDGKMI